MRPEIGSIPVQQRLSPARLVSQQLHPQPFVFFTPKPVLFISAAFIEIAMNKEMVGTDAGATGYFSGGYYITQDDSGVERRQTFPRTFTRDLMGGRFCVDGLIGPVNGPYGTSDPTIDDLILPINSRINRVSLLYTIKPQYQHHCEPGTWE